MSSHSAIQVHGFCDASQKAMSAVVYVNILNDNQVYLLCSKTKVAPLKRLTISRLELTAAVMLAKLTSSCTNTLGLHSAPCFLWTDSSIVITWLINDPSRWKEFVYNRVRVILHHLPGAQWRHVTGVTNPTDCATRGVSAKELKSHPLWLHVPPWLLQESSTWPVNVPLADSSNCALEEQTKSVCLTASVPSSWNLLGRYSDLNTLTRVTATILRAVQLFRGRGDPLTVPLSPHDLITAKKFWVQAIQKLHFAQEIDLLVANRELPKSCPLIPLTPFIDSDGLLRVGGRLLHSTLSSGAKHPYILPRDSPLSALIISDAHRHTLHGSTQSTLSHICCTYWILGGRVPVRSYILKCTTCLRYRRHQAQQLTGQLPASRINPSRAFIHAGIDYAGPLQLKTWMGRNARGYKSWIALFVCFSTSAVPLEIVSDYSSDAFLAAYRRLTARRGICSTLSSDCGTNFKGADRELQKLFTQASRDFGRFASIIANDGTMWKFNPPAAPHFGGKWEAGVKSMNFYLERVIGESLLTYEEMATVLTHVEAVLNSRPLCPLTNDTDDLDVPTPGHFLIGNALNLIPEPNLELIPRSRLSRWQHLVGPSHAFKDIRQFIDGTVLHLIFVKVIWYF